MAFVRWRGGCAPRLATVWDDGRPRPLRLTHWPGRPALTPTARTWAETAHEFRTGALTTDVLRERMDLELAAHVLTLWATRPPGPGAPPP